MLRAPDVDSERLVEAAPTLLVDPSWQSLLEEAAEAAYREGFEAGRTQALAEARGESERLVTAIDNAVRVATEEAVRCRRDLSDRLLGMALDLVERLVGDLQPAPELLGRRLEEALAELDGTVLEVRLSSSDAGALRESLSDDPRVQVVEDERLRPGEAMIGGEWCDADLTWETVFGILREACND